MIYLGIACNPKIHFRNRLFARFYEAGGAANFVLKHRLESWKNIADRFMIRNGFEFAN